MSNVTSSEGGAIVERMGHVTRVTMSTPGKKNAIDGDKYTALANALNAAANDPEVRVLWLRGADGDFTSGNMIEEFNNTAKGDNPPVVDFLTAIINFPKPIVAQVEGVAIGIGATMLLHCDLIYVADNARFRLPFVNMGLVPEAGSSYLIPRLMGSAKAAELLLLGRMFGAQEALETGLINQVLAADALEETIQGVVTELSELPPQSMMKTKALLRKPLTDTFHERVTDELTQFAAGLDGEEFGEAFSAYVEKRKPVFK